jgi:hypothetical protein
MVLPAEGDDGVVLARTRPTLNDFAGPARRPHGSFTGDDGRVAFYLRPCRVKVFLADGTLPQPNQCGNSCARCSSSSPEFVQSAHIPIMAEAATQAFTADGLAHWRGVQNAFQWHHCCFTCWKYRKRGQVSCPCRFKFPFALQDKSCFAVERSQQTGRCARSFRARRNHPYLNATCPVVAVRWCLGPTLVEVPPIQLVMHVV